MSIDAVGQQATCEAAVDGRRAVSHTRLKPQCDLVRAICAAHVLLPRQPALNANPARLSPRSMPIPHTLARLSGSELICGRQFSVVGPEEAIFPAHCGYTSVPISEDSA